jgi:hypothetical protein
MGGFSVGGKGEMRGMILAGLMFARQIANAAA